MVLGTAKAATHAMFSYGFSSGGYRNRRTNALCLYCVDCIDVGTIQTRSDLWFPGLMSLTNCKNMF